MNEQLNEELQLKEQKIQEQQKQIELLKRSISNSNSSSSFILPKISKPLSPPNHVQLKCQKIVKKGKDEKIKVLYGYINTPDMSLHDYYFPIHQQNDSTIRSAIKKLKVVWEESKDKKVKTDLKINEQMGVPVYLEAYYNCDVTLFDLNKFQSFLISACKTIESSPTPVLPKDRMNSIKHSSPLFGQIEDSDVLVIPSVLLLIDSNFKTTVKEIYQKIDQLMKILFPKTILFPFASTESHMESKQLYLKDLMTQKSMKKLNNFVQKQENITLIKVMFQELHCSFESINGLLPPTVIIPNFPFFKQKLGANWNNAIKCLAQLLSVESKNENVEVKTNEFIVKSTNGTRATSIKIFQMSKESIEKTFEDSMSDSDVTIDPVGWLDGIILQPFMPALVRNELKFYCSHAQIIKLLITSPDTSNDQNPCQQFYNLDVQPNMTPTSASNFTTYSTYISYQYYFHEFIYYVLSKTAPFSSDPRINLVTTTPILRVDISFYESKYEEKQSNETYPHQINHRSIAISSTKKIVFFVNEITSTLDIQFSSTSHSYPLIQTTAHNSYSLLCPLFMSK